jgi:hypothetical protein
VQKIVNRSPRQRFAARVAIFLQQPRSYEEWGDFTPPTDAFFTRLVSDDARMEMVWRKTFRMSDARFFSFLGHLETTWGNVRFNYPESRVLLSQLINKLRCALNGIERLQGAWQDLCEEGEGGAYNPQLKEDFSAAAPLLEKMRIRLTKELEDMSRVASWLARGREGTNAERNEFATKLIFVTWQHFGAPCHVTVAALVNLMYSPDGADDITVDAVKQAWKRRRPRMRLKHRKHPFPVP